MAYNNREYIPTHITGSTTTLVFSGKGTFHGIVVNATTGTAIGIFDGITTNVGTIALMKSSIVENFYDFDAVCANGLFLTTGINGDYTVLWTKG